MNGSEEKRNLISEESCREAGQERVREIPLTELFPFEGLPFSVREDESMAETVESIKQYGVLTPAIARPREDGGYEILSGHRRKRACELAGLETMPVIVREMDRDSAIIFMVDSNLQRENVLPSKRAQAYKMKLEAVKRKSGERTDLTSAQLGQRLKNKTSREMISQNSPDSSSQIQRLIRLTELSPQLQQMVDEKKIGLTPAMELSYLKPEEQSLLTETIESEQALPSLSQAQRMKKLSQSDQLNEDTMLAILSEEKSRRWTGLCSRPTPSANTFPAPTRPARWRKPSTGSWRAGCAGVSGSRNGSRQRNLSLTAFIEPFGGMYMENRAIIENSEFGSIRILEEDGRIYFCGSDAAKILGYANPPAALKRHCRYITKRYTPHPQSPGKMMSMEFIPEGDLYRLIIHSKLPSAERFER